MHNSYLIYCTGNTCYCTTMAEIQEVDFVVSQTLNLLKTEVNEDFSIKYISIVVTQSDKTMLQVKLKGRAKTEIDIENLMNKLDLPTATLMIEDKYSTRMVSVDNNVMKNFNIKKNTIGNRVLDILTFEFSQNKIPKETIKKDIDKYKLENPKLRISIKFKKFHKQVSFLEYDENSPTLDNFDSSISDSIAGILTYSLNPEFTKKCFELLRNDNEMLSIKEKIQLKLGALKNKKK